MIRKRKIALMILVTFLSSCSTKKTIVTDYYSEKLCGGITEMSNYIENSNEIKNYFIESNSGNTKLNYEVTELVTEGICFPFLQSEVAKIIENEEKISLEQANRILEVRFLSKPILILNSRCLEKRKFDKPDVKIEYYYYPEYNLLTAEITKIKYSAEYGKGYLILAKINADKKIEVLKTTFWEE
tara:strand:+ start:46 stop:600 length:555 start_codon:yes stop_codon:yes gene_type:complete